MTTDVEASERRKRGSVRRMGACLQVRVSAGEDPSTGERIVLVESVPIEKPGNERSERAAMTAAEKIRTRLLAEADSLKVARTKSTLGALLDRWLPQHEVDPTTRMNYESQIRNYIKPNLGDLHVNTVAGVTMGFFRRVAAGGKFRSISGLGPYPSVTST